MQGQEGRQRLRQGPGAALGAKNEKDAAKLKAGVAKAGEGKEGDATYDSILKGGKLPKAAE